MSLNDQDKREIRQMVREEMKIQLDESLDDKFMNFKSDLFDRIDPILHEVQTAREERPLVENRLEALEDKVGIHS